MAPFAPAVNQQHRVAAVVGAAPSVSPGPLAFACPRLEGCIPARRLKAPAACRQKATAVDASMRASGVAWTRGQRHAAVVSGHGPGAWS